MASPATDLSQLLGDERRLATLRATELLDSPTEEAFDRLSRIAAKLLDAPVALVSLVGEDRQFFKSCIGLAAPWSESRQTPLSHSFCQHAVASGQPLIVRDARENPALCDNLALPEMSVIAYAGIPLTTRDGVVLGSFCVIDHEPREWSDEDIADLKDLATAVMALIELRLTRNALRRRAHEEALESERFRDALGTVAHDLRNPINAAQGAARLIQMVDVDGPSWVPDQLDVILRSTEHMDRLVDDLLEAARPEGGALSVEIAEEPLEPLLAEALDSVRARAAAEEIALETELPPELPPVCADRWRVLQILGNLLGNAIKFTPAGGTVTVRAEPEQGGDHVRIEVADSGPGFPEEALPLLFEPFWQHDRHDRRGIGLGLSIARRLAEAHGGAIGARNRPDGGGAVVHFTLPTGSRGE